MTALKSGQIAPDFSLPDMGGASFSLAEALTRGPVVAVFFKISCPTCQYALPFYERIYQAYGALAAAIVGISQNHREDTAMFNKTFSITFPVLLDDTETYPASNTYGLTNVPTVFWIGQDGEIEISSVGWDRKDFEAINVKMAGASLVIPAFRPGEDVPAFRAG
ncbi:MAG TPA: TlpA disulfide reductase family protein [Terriglobales bacterium]|jgi:peroxiredoxin|nr:TlpA disulfide reductase family protein [Terriglobales bacterium]